MAETKTKPTGASVDAYLASRASPEQLADCKAIMAMCKRVTKQQPKMWGPSIVGYGSYTYRYESGHSGDACLAGFAVRGKELVVYLIAENPEQVELLAKLGRHKMGKVLSVLQAPGGPRCQGPRGTHCRVGRRSQTPVSEHRRRLAAKERLVPRAAAAVIS